jgi:hypothetical protein
MAAFCCGGGGAAGPCDSLQLFVFYVGTLLLCSSVQAGRLQRTIEPEDSAAVAAHAWSFLGIAARVDVCSAATCMHDGRTDSVGQRTMAGNARGMVQRTLKGTALHSEVSKTLFFRVFVVL